MALSVYTKDEDQWDRSHGVASLTDKLLNNIYGDGRMNGLSEAVWAVQAENFFEHRIRQIGEGNILYPNDKGILDGHYAMPRLDIGELTAVGVAMAMLIMSTMENEIMLDTQIEGVKGTQSQKLSASVTKMQKLREQIRKARYKSRFQKFMAWLMDTWLMKFLNSNFGKVVMFLITAAVTIATFGAAGPAMIALQVALMAFQAAELIMGKSMGELITQSMPDGTAKMALQISIDVAMMAASMGAGAASGAGKAVEAVDKIVDVAQTGAKMLQTGAKAAQTVAKAASTVANVIEKVQKVISEIQKVMQRVQMVLELVNSINNFAKSQEQATIAWSAGQVEAIKMEYEGKDAFYQMIIDHQMADIETQINYVKASFARAAEVIREHGETSRMIAQNLVI
jgi:hypothetical protein